MVGSIKKKSITINPLQAQISRFFQSLGIKLIVPFFFSLIQIYCDEGIKRFVCSAAQILK